MKKIVVIIVCLLSVLCASASPIYGGIAQAPTARMYSTSSMLSAPAGGNTTYGSVRGIRTSASSVYGGVTSGQTLARISSIRRGINPEIPDDPWWHCGCIDEDGDEICDICGCDLRLVDENGICGCDGYCWCPLEFDWKVFLFFSAFAGAYALYKVRASKKKSEAC